MTLHAPREGAGLAKCHAIEHRLIRLPSLIPRFESFRAVAIFVILSSMLLIFSSGSRIDIVIFGRV